MMTCAASDRQRWEATLVGKELELVGPGGVVRRFLAARTPSGPVLTLAGPASSADGSRDFWLMLPVSDASGMSSSGPLAGDATFGSDTGLALAGFSDIGFLRSPESITLGNTGLPNSYFLYANKHEYCGLDAARLWPTALPSLFAGDISASSWRGSCWGGASYAVMTGQVRAMLGVADGPLKGRWLIAVRP